MSAVYIGWTEDCVCSPSLQYSRGGRVGVTEADIFPLRSVTSRPHETIKADNCRYRIMSSCYLMPTALEMSNWCSSKTRKHNCTLDFTVICSGTLRYVLELQPDICRACVIVTIRMQRYSQQVDGMIPDLQRLQQLVK